VCVSQPSFFAQSIVELAERVAVGSGLAVRLAAVALTVRLAVGLTVGLAAVGLAAVGLAVVGLTVGLATVKLTVGLAAVGLTVGLAAVGLAVGVGLGTVMRTLNVLVPDIVVNMEVWPQCT
jgi:hypothetical protein